jgi:hypothetical protein
MRGWVRHLQCCWLSPAQSFSCPSLAGLVTIRVTVSDSRLPQSGGQVTVLMYSRKKVVLVYPQVKGSLFVASYDSQGYGGGSRPRYQESESELRQTGQSASLSWNKAPVWALRPDFINQTVAGWLRWGALSDKRTGLSFTVDSGPRQRSHFRVRVSWDSWPYFTVSDSRLPISSPLTTRRTPILDSLQLFIYLRPG